MANTNTSKLKSTLKYQQLQEEQILKEIDIVKHELNEDFKQKLSVQKAAYTKETAQFQDEIDKLQFELNVRHFLLF
jgi:ABC-type phosphate transport system auxiliary subunit